MRDDEILDLVEEEWLRPEALKILQHLIKKRNITKDVWDKKNISTHIPEIVLSPNDQTLWNNKWFLSISLFLFGSGISVLLSLLGSSWTTNGVASVIASSSLVSLIYTRKTIKILSKKLGWFISIFNSLLSLVWWLVFIPFLYDKVDQELIFILIITTFLLAPLYYCILISTSRAEFKRLQKRASKV